MIGGKSKRMLVCESTYAATTNNSKYSANTHIRFIAKECKKKHMKDKE